MKGSSILVLVLAAGLAACASPSGVAPPSAAPTAPIDEIVVAANKEFRERYAATRTGLRHQTSPYVIVSFGKLMLYRQGEQVWNRPFQTPLYDDYKTVAHMPLATYVTALPYADGSPSDELRRSAASLRDRVRALSGALDRTRIPAAHLPQQRAILDPTLQMLDRLVADGTVPRRDLEVFARRLGPLELANADLAGADMVEQLHAAASEMRGLLAPGEWQRLYVLVLGGKMPRVGYLQYEYFARIMGSGERERRLLYAEGVATPEAAINLLGAVVIDRTVGEAFFADPYRMDRDLLGDAARKHLDRLFGPAR